MRGPVCLARPLPSAYPLRLASRCPRQGESGPHAPSTSARAPLGRAWGRPRRWALVRLRAFRTSAWRPPCRRPGLSHQAAHAGSRVCVHRRWLRAALHAQGHTRHAPCPCGGHWPRAPVPPYGLEVRAQSGPHGGRTKRPGLAPAGGLRGALPAPAFQLPPLPLLFLWNLQMLPRYLEEDTRRPGTTGRSPHCTLSGSFWIRPFFCLDCVGSRCCLSTTLAS